MMGIRRRSSRGSVAALVLAAILAFAGTYLWFARSSSDDQTTIAAQAGEPADVYMKSGHATLFQTGSRASLPAETGLIPYESNESGNRYVVHVSRVSAQQSAATKTPLAIHLPTGESFKVHFERTERAPNGDWTFVGKVATRLGPQSAVLTFGRAGLFGVLPVPDGGQMQLTTTRGVTVLEPVRPMHPRDPATGKMPVDFVVPQQATQKPGPTPNSGNVLLQADHATVAVGPRFPMNAAGTLHALATAATPAPEVQIDVLGLYTKNMVELRGSVAAAETECNNYLAIANQAHLDSNTGVKFRFVGLRQVDPPSYYGNEFTLWQLRANNLRDGTDVYALRDSLRADLVALLRPYVDGDSNGGIAYTSRADGQEAYGYSVSNLNPYTFAHETGHNLGSAHDIATATTDDVIGYGAFEYSFGYRQDGPPAFATIMAYPAAGQSQLGYFSHPGTTACLNVACGTAAADNARSLRTMASVIAEYRLPLNLISITAVPVVEGDPGNLRERLASITVKLSTPAPAGGVRFDVATQDGTALAGADYAARSQSGVVIPEGESVWNFSVKILPDELIEGDESFKVVISNVQGAGVYRGSTDVQIVDDDPRVAVTGRLLAPAGYTMPTSAVWMEVTERRGPDYQQAGYWAFPPNFEYRIPVRAGSSVSGLLQAQPPYSDFYFDLGVVNVDRHRDLVLKRIVKLTGSLRFEAGQPKPTSPITVSAWGQYGNSNVGKSVIASPPDYSFSFDVAQGTEVRLDTNSVPAPFVDQGIALGEIWSDRVQDIQVGLVPSMAMSGARVIEGASGQERTVTLILFLSTRAPAGGSEVDVALVNGTAVAGSDFVGKTKTRITIGAGDSVIGVPIVIKGDAYPEPTEWFKVVLSNPSGAWLPTSEAVVYIENDDFATKRNDFDGDGYSDLFWRNLADGRNVVWFAAEAGIQSSRAQVSNLAWSVVGTGDFDGDRKSDLFWRNSGSGQNIIWRSGDASGMRDAATVASQDWSVAAIADFNGDGRDDIFWRNTVSGQNIIWWSGESASYTVELSVATSWKIAGAGDLDGDGQNDLLWRNASSGANIVWWSGKSSGLTALASVGNLSWEVVALGDFDGDGRADLFWRNRMTGENIIWRHGSDSDWVREPTVSTAWEVRASGDYDGDGNADVFWRNSNNGQNAIWNSARYATGRSITGVTDLSWKVLP